MDSWIHACGEFIMEHELIQSAGLLSAVVVAIISFSIFVRWIFKLK